MLKKSTLLSVSIFFLLFIGLNTPSYACHQGRPPHGNQTICDDSDSDDTKFSVAITGAVSGGSGQDWSGGQGGKVVAGNIFSQPDLGSLTDLSFFTLPASQGGPFSGTRGENCFGIGNAPADFFPQVILKQGRGGRADSSFWFIGSTDQDPNIELQTEVLYVLSGFGLFKNLDGTSDPDPIWPPPVNGTTLLVITDWELRVENEGKVIKNLSCIGGGEFADVTPMVIAVTQNE